MAEPSVRCNNTLQATRVVQVMPVNGISSLYHIELCQACRGQPADCISYCTSPGSSKPCLKYLAICTALSQQDRYQQCDCTIQLVNDFFLAMLCSMWTDISPRKIQFYASEGSAVSSSLQRCCQCDTSLTVSPCTWGITMPISLCSTSRSASRWCGSAWIYPPMPGLMPANTVLASSVCK